MLLGAGLLMTIAGFALGTIPLIKKYALALKVLGVTVLSLALYLEGGLADNKEWELKVEQAKVQAAQTEAQGANKNVEIQEKIVEKTKVIREKGRDIIKYIDREVVKNEEVVKYIETCPSIPQSIIDEHNKAATK